MAELVKIDIDRKAIFYDAGQGTWPYLYYNGIKYVSSGHISSHFMLFSIIMCENGWITHISWHKLLKMAKNYRKRGKMTLKDRELKKFLNKRAINANKGEK